MISTLSVITFSAPLIFTPEHQRAKPLGQWCLLACVLRQDSSGTRVVNICNTELSWLFLCTFHLFRDGTNFDRLLICAFQLFRGQEGILPHQLCNARRRFYSQAPRAQAPPFICHAIASVFPRWSFWWRFDYSESNGSDILQVTVGRFSVRTHQRRHPKSPDVSFHGEVGVSNIQGLYQLRSHPTQ